DPTGKLKFVAPLNQIGQATITVTVSDNGGTANGGVNTFTRTFVINVIEVNKAPTIDNIADPQPILENAGTQTIFFTGVNDNNLAAQNITITSTSSNPGLIPDPTVSYTNPNTFGTLKYAPVPFTFGTAIITVTIQDDGGTANGGSDTTVLTFRV